MNLKDSLKSLTHHAYCLIGGAGLRDELILLLNETHKIKTQGSSDFFDRSYETFSIDDAREVKASAGMRPMSDEGKKIFVLTMNGITIEAQNALLKLLEEPAEYAIFFLIIPSAHLLLPTVKSRVCLVEGTIVNYSGKESGDVARQELKNGVESFLKAPAAKRLEIIKKLMEDITKEKKTKQDAIDFLNAIEEAVYAKGNLKANKKSLQAIELARTYMNDRAPSLKMLLEYVALNV